MSCDWEETRPFAPGFEMTEGAHVDDSIDVLFSLLRAPDDPNAELRPLVGGG